MRRILVVGSSGAGKSTLAGELARRLDLREAALAEHAPGLPVRRLRGHRDTARFLADVSK
ncbi:hypothetical protein ACGF5H_16265 [Micromonospora chalcea]